MVGQHELFGPQKWRQTIFIDSAATVHMTRPTFGVTGAFQGAFSPTSSEVVAGMCWKGRTLLSSWKGRWTPRRTLICCMSIIRIGGKSNTRTEVFSNKMVLQLTPPCTQSILWRTKIVVLPSPAPPPNMKHTENLWGMLPSAIHAHWRQFDTVDYLTEALLCEWKKLIYNVYTF